VFVCLLYTYQKGAEGSLEQEAGLDNLWRYLPAWISLRSVWGDLQILVPQGDNELS